MDEIILIGRIIFGGYFVFAGLNHFLRLSAMTGYAQFKGAPFPREATIASGALFMLGGLSIALGVWGDLGALVLAAVLVVVTAVMHQFWKESDAQSRMAEMVNFNKNIALIGAAIVLFGLFAGLGADLGLTVTDPLWSID